MKSPHDLKIGQVLVIPPSPKASASQGALTASASSAQVVSSGERTHQVGSGESLYKIALKYYGRATPKEIDRIYQANRSSLSSPDRLSVGTKLVIP
jgi:nucleoid-associated protein YgaU